MIGQFIVSLGGIIEPFLFFTAYISSSSSFPKPLTREEEEDYLKLYFEGDETARNILIERNLRLVAHIVKKYNNIGIDIEDLISIGTIGLIKGISTFDMGRGTRLATYAARCIENEILMTLRSNKRTSSEISIQEPIGIDKEGNEISLLDILGTDIDDITDEVYIKIQINKLNKAIDKVLKDREKIIIQLRYGLIDGAYRTQREIGKILGISRSYVSRIEKRALNRLERELNS